jgi:deoxyhypusine monooxygenase
VWTDTQARRSPFRSFFKQAHNDCIIISISISIMWGTAPSMDKLVEAIVTMKGGGKEDIPSPHPIGMRMRAAYYLKQTYIDSKTNQGQVVAEPTTTTAEQQKEQQQQQQLLQSQIIETLCLGLRDKRHGSLMRHEFAYVLGQLADPQSCPILEDILQDATDCVMVRHEAAEALGAIGLESSRHVLVQHCQSDQATKKKKDDIDDVVVPQELADTCVLSLNVMDWRLRKQRRHQKQQKQQEPNKVDDDDDDEDDDEEPVGCACLLNPYSSIDPAPAHPAHATLTVEELGDILRNESLDLFQRYRAMFSLRNRGGESAVLELCRAMVQDTSSVLFRHEVAYVLGQLQHPESIHALSQIVQRSSHQEHMMVRHEAAEALGAIQVTSSEQWTRIESILQQGTTDSEPVVAESCWVALDAADYWGHSNDKDDDDNDDDDNDVNKNDAENDARNKEKNKNESMSDHKNGQNEEHSYHETSFGHQKAVSEKQKLSAQHFNMVQ